MWASQYLPERVLQVATALYFRASTISSIGFKKFHSAPQAISREAMDIKILPALSDNLMYLIVDKASKDCAVVDPVEPQKVVEAVKDLNVNLTTVLTTHHHWDHAGGNEGLVGLVDNLLVYGGDDRIGALNNKVSDGQEFSIGSLHVTCLATPCHTTGHICYFVKGDQGPPAVFTGDTLFIGGCGRFFEGTADQMHKALIETLGNLPDESEVFCGHEYSLKNLSFGAHVEPDNVHIQKRIKWSEEMRQAGNPTVPSTIGMEKKINPFMRTSEAAVKSHTNQEEPIAVMKALRDEKDKF